MIGRLCILAKPLRGSACVEAMRLIAALGEWQAALAGLATIAVDDDAALVTLARERSRFVEAVEASERMLAVAGVARADEIAELRAKAALRRAVWEVV